MNLKSFTTILFCSSIFFSACKDLGTDPVIGPDPIISTINPSAALLGDTITIAGSNFSSVQGTNKVNFGTISANIISWNATQIMAIVPSSLSPGSANLSLVVGGKTSNIKTFSVITNADLARFSLVIQTKIGTYNCANCHPGNGGFSVASYSTILAGGSTGNTVIPGNGSGSNLVKKLLGTAGFGNRMPQGGTPMNSQEIQKFIDWIDQGAKNN